MADSSTDDPSWDPSLPPFERAETFLSGRAREDLPTLALGQTATDILGKVLERTELPHLDGQEATNDWVQTKACIYLGMLAGRSMRAVLLLLCYGYDSETLILKRRLDEVHARIKRVTNPQHGAQHARDWLQGKDRKPSQVVELPKRAWDLHSHVAHADYRAVEHHLVERRGDEDTAFTLLPHRGIERSNMTAVLCASMTRDVAAVIADFKNLRIHGLHEFDAELDVGIKEWLTPPAG